MSRSKIPFMLLLATLFFSVATDRAHAEWQDGWTAEIKEFNAFKILNLPRNASENTIKKTYRSLAMKYHPDRNPGSSLAGDKFKEVKSAYEFLDQYETGWKKTRIFALEFAIRPIQRNGLGWDATSAESWAIEMADKYTDESGAPTKNVADYSQRYKTALEVALKPVNVGGLGISSTDARDWAIKAANTHKTEKDLKEYLQKLSSKQIFSQKVPSTPSTSSTSARASSSRASTEPPRTGSSTSNTSSASTSPPSQPEKAPPSATWKEKYVFAFDFASRPIQQNGLGYDATVAREWATAIASKINSPIALASYSLQYETALKFALKPVSEGGLGRSPVDARNWAATAANSYTTRDSLMAYLRKLSAQPSAGPCFEEHLRSAFRSH